jgi:hypothetical protein
MVSTEPRKLAEMASWELVLSPMGGNSGMGLGNMAGRPSG